MTDPRIDPPYIGSERELLVTFLDWQRDTLAWKCSGLTDEQLRERSVPPSPMSLLGLVRHLADVERAWFRRIMLDENAPAIHWTDASPDGDFDEVNSATREESFAVWEREVAAAREAIKDTPMDAVGKRQRKGTDISLRWILIHMIEEYARHNGHADLLRERIDGTVGE